MASRGHTSSVSSPTEGVDGSRKAGRRSAITRVRTGCFTCRKRKKKCDEQKPACGNCKKTGVVCEGFPKPQQWEHRVAVRRHQARNASVASPTTFKFQGVGGTCSSMLLPGFDTPPVAGGFPPSQPGYDFMMESHYGSNFQYAFDQSSSDLTGLLGLSHEGDSFVDYQGFNQMNAPSREMGFSQELERRLQLPQQSSIPMELPFLISGVDTDIQRRMFCHFTGVMSSVLAMTVNDSNPFNAVVIPLALRDRTVMDAVLCLAGSHLAKLQQGDCDGSLLIERSRLYEDAVQVQANRVKTLKSLPQQSGVNYAIGDQDPIVAASLLLCLYEVCEGTGDDKWRQHLDMARQVITAVSRNGESSSTDGNSPTASGVQEAIVTDIDPFLLEFFLYHDRFATVTTAPSVPNRPIYSATMLPQDSYVVGVQDGLSDFVTRISTLRVQADASPNMPDGDVVCKAVSIWEDLARWKPKAVVSAERQLIAEFYQWALFIWLFSIVYPEGKADAKVQGALRRIADGMCNIKSGEGVMSCLLFPLFIIGSAAIGFEDRNAISAQFARLRAWSSLGNIDLTYGIVQQMWKDHDRSMPKSWDWVKQLERRGISFLVT